MQRGVSSLARRSPIGPSSTPFILRAGERGGAKKKLKPFQKYKGQKGDLFAVLGASNKWNYNFYKTVEEMPPELRRLEIYTPYNNVRMMYNPNDPSEIKSYLAQKRARKIRESNEVSKEHKGLKPKEWRPDGRLVGVDELVDENEDENDNDEMLGEDDETIEYRQWKGAKKMEETRKQAQVERRGVIVEGLKKYVEEFDKMSDADKVKKLTEAREATKKIADALKAEEDRILSLPVEGVYETLRKEHNLTEEQEEQLLRDDEAPTLMSEDERVKKMKEMRLGVYEVPGELNGFDYFLSQRAPRLIGFMDRLYSKEPPKIEKASEKKADDKKGGKDAGKGDKGDKGKAAEKGGDKGKAAEKGGDKAAKGGGDAKAKK